MESLDVVKFGIFDDFSHVFGTGAITTVLPLNHREMIISTTKEIIKIERNIIKMRQPIKFSTCALVPDTDFLIGITVKRGDIVIYQIGDLPQTQQSYNSRSVELPPPLLDNYPTNQSGIFHVIYSPKSQSIITIGAGIKVFNLQYKLSRISVIKPTVSISHRSSFASDYATTILVPPQFDIESELILLPTDDGICAFNLDGEKVMQCSKFPASVKTVYATHPSKPPKLAEISSDGKEKKPVLMTKKLLTYDSNKGLSLWGKRGQLIDQFNTIGSSVLAIMFVDSENALCLNSNHALFFLNIKTGKTFFCLNLDKNPSRVFLTFVNKQPILCACFSSFMRALKIVIPWRVWNLNIDEAFLLCRCNKFRSAARVLIDSENAFIKFYSPRDGSKMTVATPAEAANSVSFLYDRGIVENYIFDEENLRYKVQVLKITNEEKNQNKTDENNDENKNDDSNNQSNGRDILFIILENGTILGFDTNVSNCEEVMKMKCKAAFMSICRIKSTKKRYRQSKQKEKETENDDEEKESYQWCYAVASEKSDLFILDYFSMKEVRHFTVSDDKLIKMFYHFESECIIMVFERKSIMFDIEKGKIISTILVGGNQITVMFGNFLIFGYESGHIRRVVIENKQFALADNKRKKKKENTEEEDENSVDVYHESNKSNSTLQKPHDGPITGFSFSQKIWISSGLDGNIIVWDYNFEKVFKIILPLPLKACLIMNGRRDILVATNTEVMQIKDTYLLDYFEDDPYDEEIEDIDNFDKIKDALCHDSVEAFDPDAYDNLSMSDILSDENNEEEEEEKKKKQNTKKKFDLPKLSNTPKKPLTTTTPVKTVSQETPSHQDNNKNKKPSEDSKEDIQKKLEMMQAMNGIGSSNVGGPPPVSTTTKTTSSEAQPKSKPAETKKPEKKEEKVEKENKKEPEQKKRKPPKDGKALSDFINNNMEQEKAQNKKKKVKKNNNQDKEPVKDEGPKKSEEEVANMIGNLFDRNKPKNQTNSTKKKPSGEGIDFNELAKKFQKDEDPLVINLDKADLSKKGKGKDDDVDDSEDDDDDDDESSPKKKSSNQNSKPKTNSPPKSSSKPTTTSNAKEKEKPSTSNKQNSPSKSNAKPKEKENNKSNAKPKEKDNTKSNATPNEKENKTGGNKGKTAKSNSNSKPQKESPKSTAKPQESTSNENKVNNNSPKKAKQTNSTKSNSKPISNSNANNFSSNPTSTTSNPNKIISSNSNSNNNNNNNNNFVNSNKQNSNPISKAGTNSGFTNNNNNSSQIQNNDSSQIQNNDSSQIQNNDSSQIQNTNDDYANGNDYDNSNVKSNKVSIGTQGDKFEDNKDDNENSENKLDQDDSMHLQVKMNGPKPVTEEATVSQSQDDETNKNNEDNGDVNDNNTLMNINDENDTTQPAEEQIADGNSQQELQANDADDNSQQKIQKSNKVDNQNTNAIKNNSKSSGPDVVQHENENENEDEIQRSNSSSDTKPQRAPTPPPIRPQLSTDDQQEERISQAVERKRSRTPPPRREKPTSEFRMPPPNIIIDQEAVLVLYGRGRLEFKPLVDRIQRDMMIASQGTNGGFYTHNKRITLAYVQNYNNSLKNENEDDKKFSKTAQPIVPPITPPRALSPRSNIPNDRSIFDGSTNNISPAFRNKNRNRNALSVTMQPLSTPSEQDSKSGVNAFNVSIEKADGSGNQIHHNRRILPDFHNSFSPAAYVYNYESNTETVFNDLDTNSAITTPRKFVNGDDNDNENDTKNDDDELNDPKSFYQKSPRRIQSARTVGRPLLTPSSSNARDPQVRMPFPLSPVVMASPRRTISNGNNGLRKRPLFVDQTANENDENDEAEIPIDQLESAVMTKMPKLHFSPNSPYIHQFQQQQSPNVQPNFGQSPSYPSRPSSVRTFDRSPLTFNQPIGSGMLKPGNLKKRNAAFYASVAVTTSISNARRSSPAYRTGSSRSVRQNNNRNVQIDDNYNNNSLTKTQPNEIEITVK